MTATLPSTSTLVPNEQKLGIIDADVHPMMSPNMMRFLPERWQNHVAEYGVMFRQYMTGGERPRHREFAHRWDTEVPGGGMPGGNEAFAREQLLDRYDMSAALLNDIGGFRLAGAGGMPTDMAVALCRAANDARAEQWFSADSRWYGSLTVPYESGGTHAADEIRRAKESEYGDRWKQVLLAPDNTRPAGNQMYWPMYEACEHYGLPVGFHVLASHRVTPSGPANYYFEEHCDFALFNFPAVSSLIMEGVFERFPKLKIAMVELAWSWAVPFAWRLDNAFRMSRTEVPHLNKLPSEYLAEHFYYTTQPMEEPENGKWFDDVLEVFESSGMSKRLMYSSDYPHWDFDEPSAFPKTLSDAQMQRLLGENARDLYGIDLIPNTGLTRM